MCVSYLAHASFRWFVGLVRLVRSEGLVGSVVLLVAVELWTTNGKNRLAESRTDQFLEFFDGFVLFLEPFLHCL
jgi:hypothetical protein